MTPEDVKNLLLLVVMLSVPGLAWWLFRRPTKKASKTPSAALHPVVIERRMSHDEAVYVVYGARDSQEAIRAADLPPLDPVREKVVVIPISKDTYRVTVYCREIIDGKPGRVGTVNGYSLVTEGIGWPIALKERLALTLDANAARFNESIRQAKESIACC